MYSKSEDWSGSFASMQFHSSKCSKCLFANEMESLGVEKCGSNIIGVLVMVCHYKNDVHWLLQMKTFESNEIRFRYFPPPPSHSLSLSLSRHYFSVLLKDSLQISSRLFGNIWRSFLPTIEQTLLSAAQVEKWIASVYLTFKKDETDKLDSWPLSDFYWNRQSTTAGTEPRTMCVCICTCMKNKITSCEFHMKPLRKLQLRIDPQTVKLKCKQCRGRTMRKIEYFTRSLNEMPTCDMIYVCHSIDVMISKGYTDKNK